MPLLSRAKRNLLLAVSEQLGMRVINFLTFVIIARYVAEEEIGTLGLAWTVVFFFEALTTTALIPAFIQHRHSNLLLRSTFFWLCTIGGVVGSGLMVAGAWTWGWFRTDFSLVGIVNFTALIFLIRMLGTAHQSVLLKEERQGFIATRTTISSIVGGVVGITLAVSGVGIWALLWRTLASAIIDTLGSLFYRPWWPAARLSKRAARQLIGFSGSLVVAQFGKLVIFSAQQFTITGVRGIEAMGRLTVAARVPEVFYQTLSSINDRFLLPYSAAEARKKKDPQELFMRIVTIGSVLMVVGLLILFPLREWFVGLIFGERWLEVSLAFFIIIAGTCFGYLRHVLETMLTANGHPRGTLIGFGWLAAGLPFYILGAFHSLEAAVLARALSEIGSFIHLIVRGRKIFPKSAPQPA